MEIATQTVKADVTDKLERLGFTRAASNVKTLSARKRKLALAYEHYRFVRQEKIDAFNAKLYKETYGKSTNYAYQTLAFTSIEHYEGAPPADVLDALETAQERKCFDSFEVAAIREVHDPILFGRIEGCSDRFFIGQWDDDVSIDDLLKPNEG